MVIHIAKKEDIESIAALTVSNWRETYAGLLSAEFLAQLSPKAMAEEWGGYGAKAEQAIYVAEENGEFLGFVACKPDAEIENCYYLDSLHVAKTARGKGIGTALIQTVLNRARNAGYSGVSICVVRGNDKARRLYTWLGAAHYKDFDDDFHGTVAHSEKLLWSFEKEGDTL